MQTLMRFIMHLSKTMVLSAVYTNETRSSPKRQLPKPKLALDFPSSQLVEAGKLAQVCCRDITTNVSLVHFPLAGYSREYNCSLRLIPPKSIRPHPTSRQSNTSVRSTHRKQLSRVTRLACRLLCDRSTDVCPSLRKSLLYQ